jgi:hypothetical protein
MLIHGAFTTVSVISPSKGERVMKKVVRLTVLAFLLAIGLASVSSAKGNSANHAIAMSGTVSSVDQTAKSFLLKAKDGKETPISWTAATKVRGGELKEGERVNVSVFAKDGKNIATSIRISPAKVAKAS